MGPDCLAHLGLVLAEHTLRQDLRAEDKGSDRMAAAAGTDADADAEAEAAADVAEAAEGRIVGGGNETMHC